MVEGLLLTQIDDKVASIEPHCWNIIGERYYDTTIDYLLRTKEYEEIIGKKRIKHIYFSCVEYLPQEIGYLSDISTFYYNYDFLVDYIKSNLRKQ